MRLRTRSQPLRRKFATAAVLAAGLFGCAKLPSTQPRARPAPIQKIKTIPLHMLENSVMKSVQMIIPPQNTRLVRSGDGIFTAVRDDKKNPIVSICSIDSIDQNGIWLTYDYPYAGAHRRVFFWQPEQIGPYSTIEVQPTNRNGVVKVTITGYDTSYPLKNPGGILPFLPVIRP